MSDPKMVPVDLETPVQRGDTALSQILVRKPAAGELRGLKLNLVLQSDVTEHFKLLPRITPLLLPELEQLDPSDLGELMGTVVGFFMTPAQRAQLEALKS